MHVFLAKNAQVKHGATKMPQFVIQYVKNLVSFTKKTVSKYAPLLSSDGEIIAALAPNVHPKPGVMPKQELATKFVKPRILFTKKNVSKPVHHHSSDQEIIVFLAINAQKKTWCDASGRTCNKVCKKPSFIWNK